MSSDLNSELDAFQQFALQQLEGYQVSLEEGVAAFREYQTQLAKFKAETQPAVEELEAGDGAELDMQAILSEAKRRLAEEGLTD